MSLTKATSGSWVFVIHCDLDPSAFVRLWWKTFGPFQTRPKRILFDSAVEVASTGSNGDDDAGDVYRPSLLMKLDDLKMDFGSTGKCLVVEFLSMLLVLNSPAEVAGWLKKLSANVQNVADSFLLGSISGNCHSRLELDSILDVFDNVVEIYDRHPLKVGSKLIQSTNQPAGRYFASCLLKVGSKFHRTLESFRLENGKLTDIKFEEKLAITVNIDMESNQPDPTSNLTFNLSLKETERLARDRVHLPYTELRGTASLGVSNESAEQEKKRLMEGPAVQRRTTGRITYEPDRYDDVDEEDPDDDLDF